MNHRDHARHRRSRAVAVLVASLTLGGLGVAGSSSATAPVVTTLPSNSTADAPTPAGVAPDSPDSPDERELRMVARERVEPDGSVPAADVAEDEQSRAAYPEPVRIAISAIEVDAPVIRLGLNPDGSLEVPTEDYDDTGWWQGGSSPGEPGPAVIVGHVDSRSGPAVFHRLRDLRPGDTVEIQLADSTTTTFVVERSERYAKDEFPTERVYGPTEDPTLRLITCGGDFDRNSGHYRDNLIVFAAPAER